MKTADVNLRFSLMNVGINYKCYILIVLLFSQVLMLVRQMHQKSSKIVTTSVF